MSVNRLFRSVVRINAISSIKWLLIVGFLFEGVQAQAAYIACTNISANYKGTVVYVAYSTQGHPESQPFIVPVGATARVTGHLKTRTGNAKYGCKFMIKIPKIAGGPGGYPNPPACSNVSYGLFTTREGVIQSSNSYSTFAVGKISTSGARLTLYSQGCYFSLKAVE